MAKKYVCGMNDPVVETVAGKVRGFYFDNVYAFHGIKYAKARRFHMPEPVDHWDGVKDATNYGFICPVLENPMPDCEATIPHRFWPSHEHCQFLNVWTPVINDTDAKKAVLVWFHGGGYSSGSSIEQVAYEGANLAKNQDVVVVTVNHRLNAFGFLDLSFFGEEFKNSKNVGMADLVASLEWVRDNIAKFGGDPGNVTIFGQSGGGGKVTSLGQIPAAKGLYQKAIVMSGVFEGFGNGSDDHRAKSEEIVYAIMDELGIDHADVLKLEKTPISMFIRAVNRAGKKLAKQGKFFGWGPSQNDWYLGDPFDVGFSEQSKDITTIVGSVFAEFFGLPTEKDKDDYTAEEREAFVREKFGDGTPAVLDAFRKAYPGMNEMYVNAIDFMCRPASVKYVRMKAKDSRTPVYSYLFTQTFDYEGGKPAWHCADLPLFFNNANKVPLYQFTDLTGLEDTMVKTLVNFAKTGDPNGEGVPAWKPSTPEVVNTMIYHTDSETKDNFDDELMETVKKYAPAFSMNFHENDGDEDDEDAIRGGWGY